MLNIIVIRKLQIKTTMKYHYTNIGVYTAGQNPKYRQCQVLTRMWSRGNTHTLLVGIQNGAATEVVEDSLVISYKTKHTLTIVSNNHTSWYLASELKTTHTHTHTHTHNVYSSFIHNC